jgi:hypothetical protein
MERENNPNPNPTLRPVLPDAPDIRRKPEDRTATDKVLDAHDDLFDKRFDRIERKLDRLADNTDRWVEVEEAHWKALEKDASPEAAALKEKLERMRRDQLHATDNWLQQLVYAAEETNLLKKWLIPTAKIGGTAYIGYKGFRYAVKGGKVVIGWFRGGAAEATTVAVREANKP